MDAFTAITLSVMGLSLTAFAAYKIMHVERVAAVIGDRRLREAIEAKRFRDPIRAHSLIKELEGAYGDWAVRDALAICGQEK